ncbi:hypothetical protein D9611_014925 [Ephemerocybe angulata]|uniref:TPR-like protein n=1 Tax=Ephemerocybe angulata TaxID=980116 RepID=A0A8H5AQH5_9AGAR|nr:hypothetical protein D9611_014925 [Tulosesus angulatus]
MATTHRSDFDSRHSISPKVCAHFTLPETFLILALEQSKAVPDTSRSTAVLMQHEANRAISTPSPVAYRFPPPDPTSPPRPSFSVAPPLMNGSGKSSAQAPFAAAAPTKPAGACPLGPKDSSARHESGVQPVTSSSHASALDNGASSHQQWTRRSSSSPQESAMRGYDNEDTSPRHHEDVYEREMKLKCMAYPLAIPSTIRIGDVGLFKPNGSFHKHFNILEPSELPPYFNPLNTPIRPDDTCTYLEFEPHSFITSASIERCDDYPAPTVGTRFRSSAAEGTILSLPAGALRTEIKEISKFRDFIALNADNWARYLRDLGDRVGELRLITGQLTAPYWGIASFERNTDINLTLSYSQSAEKEARYTWNAPPSVRTTLSGKIRFSRPSDTLAVTSFTITPRGSGPPSAKVLSEDRMQEDPVAIIRHPCDYINERLLALSDKKFPDEALLIQRVFSSNELCHDEGIAFLRWKPKRVETASAADLLKEIDILRDTLDEIGDSNLVKRADCLHSITSNILTYLKVSKNKDPRDSSFLLSIAMSNVVEEAKILSEIKRETAPSLHLFASTMWAKYVITGESKLLEQAISYWHKALDIDSNYADSMNELATALWTRFTRYNQPQDLNEVIVLYRGLLFSQISNNPLYIQWLNGIGLALWERYKRTKSMNDMDHAISYFRQASVSYPTPCDPFILSNLGNILMAKAKAIKDTTESDEAISCYRRALDSVTPLHPNRSAFLTNLGDALCYRYSRRCLIADLNEALRCYERALDLPSPHHRDRVSLLVLYAERLQQRYSSTNEIEDLAEVVKRLSEAKRLASPSHPKYALVVESLALAQRELDSLDRHRSDFASPPPSSAASPTVEQSHIPTLRPTQWSPAPGAVASGSGTMKPYPSHRPRHGSSASDSENEEPRGTTKGNGSFLPHPHVLAPGASVLGHGHGHVNGHPGTRSKSPQYHRGPNTRRHHTMPGLP